MHPSLPDICCATAVMRCAVCSITIIVTWMRRLRSLPPHSLTNRPPTTIPLMQPALRIPSCRSPRSNSGHSTPSGAENARFEEAVRLREQGMTIRGIARALGVGRKTVRRWLRAGHAPTWRHADRGRSLLDPFRDYLEMRWAAGYRNGTGLSPREIHDASFTGQSGIVRQWATRQRRQDPAADQAPPAKPPKAQPPTPRKAARLLMSEPDKLRARTTAGS